MIALFNGAHEGNTAAAAAEERISSAPGENCANAFQDASSVSCPGRAMSSGICTPPQVASGNARPYRAHPESVPGGAS
jgi:hypothetical protein